MMEAQSQRDEEEQGLEEWPDLLKLLSKMAMEAIMLYYSDNLLRRLSH